MALMQNGQERGFQHRLNGSLLHRVQISGNGHGVMNFMEPSVIMHLTDQLRLMHFQKGRVLMGCLIMVGNVWQMTNDMYFNGTNYFTVIRGGSYYKPESSWWYIQGGPQSLDKTQILLMVSPGFDRSATVGFRCVKDIDSKNFKDKEVSSKVKVHLPITIVIYSNLFLLRLQSPADRNQVSRPVFL